MASEHGVVSVIRDNVYQLECIWWHFQYDKPISCGGRAPVFVFAKSQKPKRCTPKPSPGESMRPIWCDLPSQRYLLVQ